MRSCSVALLHPVTFLSHCIRRLSSVASLPPALLGSKVKMLRFLAIDRRLSSVASLPPAPLAATSPVALSPPFLAAAIPRRSRPSLLTYCAAALLCHTESSDLLLPAASPVFPPAGPISSVALHLVATQDFVGLSCVLPSPSCVALLFGCLGCPYGLLQQSCAALPFGGLGCPCGATI